MPLPHPLHSLAARLMAPVLVLFGVAAVSAAEIDARAGYIVTLGGINIAQIDVGLTEAAGRYAIDLTAQVTGLGNLVASGTAAVRSTGQASTPALLAEEFDLETRAEGDNFSVDISYRGRDVTAFRVDPPILDSADRIPLERRHMTGVTDMLAAFVIKGGAFDEALCRRDMRIFTGVERFDIQMRFAATDEATSPRTGYQGPVVLCTLAYRPVAGHYTSEMTRYLAEESRLLVWYAPLGQTGYYIPYRALVGTGAGDLSMVLTGLRY